MLESALLQISRRWLHERAVGAAYNVVSRMKFDQILEGMPEQQFEEFLEDCRLRPFQQTALRVSADRRAYYREAMAGINYTDARKSSGLQQLSD